MGVMTKMRESTGMILWVLVFAFGGLWVLQDSGAFDTLGIRQGRDVARVNGEPISYEQYRNAVEMQLRAYEEQNVEVTPTLRAQIEDQVFDALVDNRLREAEMERLGVEVSDAEVRDAILGPTPDPLVLRFFSDGRGGIDRARLMDLINNPEAQQDLVFFEEQIRQNRRSAKLDALIAATARVTDAEVSQAYTFRNRRVDAQYVALRYADVPDAQVPVTDADLRAYYDAHRDDFEREQTWTVEYVVLEKTPSPEDSARVRQELEGLRAGFAAAADPAQFARENFSEAETAPSYILPGDLAPALADAIYADLTVGRVAGPAFAGDEALLARITGVREAAGGPFVHARHILFPAAQRALAEQTKARIESGQLSFEAAAQLHSTDESNKAQGGDLGWFGPGQMVAPFDAAVFAAPIGQVVGPIETDFGLHLIRVEAKTAQEAEIVRLSRGLTGSFEQLEQQAEEIPIFAESEGRTFQEEAARRQLTALQARVTRDQPTLPGLEVGRDALRWIRRSQPGDISEPFDTGRAFVVFHTMQVDEAGVAPFDEVREQIEPRVRLEKKREVQAGRLRQAYQRAGGNLSAVAASVGQQVQAAPGLTMLNPAVPNVGAEPRFVGTAFGLDVNETSRVVEGEGVVFVVRTTAITGGDPAQVPAAERTALREQLLAQKRQQVLEAWMQALRENAEVEDFRDDLL